MSARAQSDQTTMTMEGYPMIDSRPPLRRHWLRARTLLVLLAATLTAAAACAPAASADVEWTSEVFQAPSNLEPGSEGIVRVVAANSGDTDSSGFPTISFDLPPGLTFNSLTGPFSDSNFWSCSGSPTTTCFSFIPLFGDPTLGIPDHSYVGTTGTDPVGGYNVLNLMVDVAPGATPGRYPFAVTLDGGGDTATQTHEVRIGSEDRSFGPTSDTFTAGAFDEAGDDYTQAGGHPYQATAKFRLNTRYTRPTPFQANTYGIAIMSQDTPKDIVVDLPAGFVGDPTSGPKCHDLGQVFSGSCAPATQVGVASISPPLNSGGRSRMFGVYNVVPDKSSPAQFAFRSPVGMVILTPVVRSDGDLGVSIHVKNITQADTILESAVTLWGVPADPSHDAQRCPRPNLLGAACVGHDEGNQLIDVDPEQYQPHTSTAPLRPLLSNPTECSGESEITAAHFSSWENPGSYESDGDPNLGDVNWITTTAAAPPITGCDQLQFDPSMSVSLTSSKPDSPTGLDFQMAVPQNDDPDGLATAHLRNATIVLPDGVTVNPSSANGLDACTSAQIGLVSKNPVRFTKHEPSCPLASKIGTVEVDTSLLDDPLVGDVFLARQKDNPFDSLLGIYIVVRGPGILVKLGGHVEADPQTGQLTTTVLDNPQLPFDVLTVHLDGGPRAPLSTPATCGTKRATASLTSWAGHSVELFDDIAIDCPGNATGFDPGFTAGTTDVVAGAFSPFVARITRDGGKELGRIDATLPKGLLASVKNVAVCSNTQLASAASKSGVTTQTAPSCPASSQVGTTTVGAGAGPTPFFPALPGSSASGRVFLTEPHTGTQFKVPGMSQADYGLGIEVPAVAGPFDLGTVLVRAAIYVDPETAQLVTVSDKLPRILEGIPLNVRDVRVDIDRSKFSVNPTSCRELKVAADIRAQDGTLASRDQRFQVGDCAALGLNPRVGMELQGRRQTRLGGNPALKVTLRQSGKQSNLSKVKAVLPRTLALDARNSAGDWLCSYEDGQKATCPASSKIGTATAVSPLLKRPLRGPVYFVKNVRRSSSGNVIRTLPTLLLKLGGEADINLRATSASRNGLLISTFNGIPDAKVSRFTMRIRGGGKRGILAVTGASGNLCRGSQVTKLTIRGQNGKLQNQSVRMKTPCAKKKSKRASTR